jgi:hypothetical protein
MAEPTTRRPAKNATWHHRALLSGEPGTDAAWLAAELTGDPRLAASYWLEIGSDSNADLYAQADGASFEIIDHDGTWLDMYEQFTAVWEMVREAGLPVALIVTSMSGVRSMLNDAASAKARRRQATVLAGRGLDPAAAFSSEAPVEIGPDIRTLMTARHQQLIAKIRTWPGPVVMTAREVRTPDGHWSLKAHDQLGFDVTAWVRLTRDDEPEIVVLDTAHHHRLTRSQREALRSQFTLPKLIWDWSGCDEKTRAPEPRVWDADQVLPGERPAHLLQAVKTVRQQPRRAATVAPRPAAASGEPLPPEAERVAAFTDLWLQLDDRDKVQPEWERMLADVGGALDTDIAGLLSDQDRDTLGVTAGQKYTLDDLATRAAQHIRRTRTALCPRPGVGVA